VRRFEASQVQADHERSAYDRPVDIDADEANVEGASSAKVSAAAFGDAIRLNFRMVAPPERKADASAKAIEFYEKKRLITAGRVRAIYSHKRWS
jgi:hypothetical protein